MDGYPPFANLVYDADTMSWVRMTQPLVDSLTSNLYLAVDGVEQLLADIKTQGATDLDGAPRDAFQRYRTSHPVAIFDTSFHYGINGDDWFTGSAGGGAVVHSTASGMVTLTVTSGSTDSAILQSTRYHRYQPGKSQLILMTGVIGAAATGIRKRIGYFDDNDGVFYMQEKTTGSSIVLRDSIAGTPQENAVVQADWNIDPLDGSGPSGKTLTVDSTNILVIDLQWLGAGRVRVGFDIDGIVCYAHQFLNAGYKVAPYMRTGSLPLRYQIDKTSGILEHQLQAICAAVISEGGQEKSPAVTLSAAATTGRTVATRRAILSIRPKATLNTLVNRGRIDPTDLSVIATGTNIITLVELVYNATFTGTPTWTSASASSSVEWSVHGDAAAGAITGGTTITSFLLAGSTTQRQSQLRSIVGKAPLVLNIAGANPRALSLVATDVAGTATVYGTMDWEEYR